MKSVLKEVQYEDVVVTQIITKYNRRKVEILKKLKSYIENKPEYLPLLTPVDNVIKQLHISESSYHKFYSELEEGWFDNLKDKAKQVRSTWRDAKISVFADQLSKEWKEATQEILNKFGIKDSPENAVEKLKQNAYHSELELTNNGLQALDGFYSDYDHIIDYINKMNTPKTPAVKAPVNPTPQNPPSAPQINVTDDEAEKIGKHLKTTVDNYINITSAQFKTVLSAFPQPMQSYLSRIKIDQRPPQRVPVGRGLNNIPDKEKERLAKELNTFLSSIIESSTKMIRNTAHALKINIKNLKIQEIVEQLKRKVESFPNKNDYHDIFQKLYNLFNNMKIIRESSKKLHDFTPNVVSQPVTQPQSQKQKSGIKPTP